jgi:kynurenine formamidase
MLSSEWGPDDEVDALNRITSSTILKALKLVSKGKVYDLGRVLQYEASINPAHGKFYCNTQFDYDISAEWMKKYRETDITNGYSDMNCRISMSDQSCTHIDSFNHVTVKGEDGVRRSYNRIDPIVTSLGTKRLGAETMKPIISRGVLIDVAGYKGVDMLNVEYTISNNDLQSALSRQNVTVNQGDTVLINTGWGKL